MQTNKFKRDNSLKSSDIEQNQNPQNAFSKLMAIPNDTPIRQCKMLLDTMKEDCYFQKGVIRKTNDVVVPLNVILERNKSQNYRNYERLLTYSTKKRDTEAFQRKTCGVLSVKVKKNRAKTLKEFVQQKKMKMLTEQSKYHFNDTVIQNILRDDKARQRLFDQSILIERLQYIRKQQKKTEEEIANIPAKFRGLNPKHLRIPQQHLDQHSFHRRKYVHNQKTFQYFRNALHTENNLLKTKQRQNSLVISSLMDHFSQQILNNKTTSDSQMNQCIHRLFLKYANNDSEDINKMYKFISPNNIIKFLQDFKIDYHQNNKIMKLLSQMQISQFYFLQIIHLLSLKEGDTLFAQIQPFLKNNILNHPQIYLPLQWQLFSKHRNFIVKHIKVRRFSQKIQMIYETFIKAKRSYASSYYNFDQMVEVMWLVKIYPFMISKKKLRFFYLYTQGEEVGVSISDLVQIYIYVGLSREGCPQTNVKEIVKIVSQFSKTQKK